MKLFSLFLILLFSTKASVAQEISVYPGILGMNYYQSGERISKSFVTEKMKSVPSAYAKWEKSSDQHLGALVSGGAMLGLGVMTLHNAFAMKDSKVYAYGTFGFGILSIVLELSSVSTRRKAILDYNQHISKQKNTGLSFSILPSNEGLGVALKF